MPTVIPQHILDFLTDVDMPRLSREPDLSEHLSIEGSRIPVYNCGCVILGSGAAGLRAATELGRRGCDVTIVSQSAWGGTSSCSGSDKQTLHTANTADLGDNFQEMAKSIRAGGSMDEETAYIEAVGSSRAMASLQFLGLPLPQDRFGGTLRYRTDHDETGRATSCGPRTSRLMVRVLAQEVHRLNIPLFNHTTGVRILIEGAGKSRCVTGILAVRRKSRRDDNPLGLVLFQCSSLVLAAGGPGELYRDSVFPSGCFGSLGLALEAGLELTNLTESQFGIGTRREGFPWNLSGTYVQVMPYIYSIDNDGTEYNFLANYYRSTQELASNVFRKGYQWPFDAMRMLDFGSSLVDLAIYREWQSGRRTLMDFNRNPLPGPDGLPFGPERLDDDVRTYLGNAGARQLIPIDRLRHMNPFAIELYSRYKVDITAEPLEFSVNNQHMNGGIAVDTWGRCNVAGIYSVGEAAGTHGVTRPGGAALIAGQVFGTRVAEHIAATGRARMVDNVDQAGTVVDAVKWITAILRPGSRLKLQSIRDEVQKRMSESAGFLCRSEDVSNALAGARQLNAKIRRQGIGYGRVSEIGRALQWQQTALASEAVLTALDEYIALGGGSRGARAICDPNGEAVPMSCRGPLRNFRFRMEVKRNRQEQILVWSEGSEMRTAIRPNRRFDEAERTFFERDWPIWLTGAVYELDGSA